MHATQLVGDELEKVTMLYARKHEASKPLSEQTATVQGYGKHQLWLQAEQVVRGMADDDNR